MLKDKSIVVGVCGGIAAYKAADIVSRLVKLGACVDVIMTKSAAKFISPLTFRTISKRPVIMDMFEEPEKWDIKHISLAQKADLFLVVPATANIIGKVASGIADDMLSTTIMAASCRVVLAPAMNHNMYINKITQRNISILKELGHDFIEPEEGMLACGVYGKGRLANPESIVDYVIKQLLSKKDMKGIKVLVTAGPTREPLDPVRFLTNKSSGKMGYAVARQAAKRGADVKLISGPVHIKPPENVEVTYIDTAMQMYDLVIQSYKDFDIVVLVAAVADFRPADIADQKIKKEDGSDVIKLIKNIDIAYELGKLKKNTILIGTCAETENLLENAMKKIKQKNFDMIAANDVSMEGAGFDTDTNIMKLVFRDGRIEDIPLMSKDDAAERILNAALDILNKGKAVK